MTTAPFEAEFAHHLQNEINKTKLDLNLSSAAGINLVLAVRAV